MSAAPSPPAGMRSSQRCAAKKRPFYGVQKQESPPPPAVKKQKGKKRGRTAKPKPAPVEVDRASDVVNRSPVKAEGSGVEGQTLEDAKFVPDGAVLSMEGKGPELRVKETLRMFNGHYLHFVQDEERRYKEVEARVNPKPSKAKQSKGKKSMEFAKEVSEVTESEESKVVAGDGKVEKRASKRPDLKAITKMLETKTILYPGKRIGHLPGINVGHQFFSRAEMVVLGVHGHWLNGIDCMSGATYSKQEQYKGYKFPLAVCIVLSGQYEDDLDNSEDVIYTGQGGHDLLGNKQQIADQKLVRGNLALTNNMECKVPVRVVRGHTSLNSYCGKVYTYDGLYMVQKYWVEKGVSGFTIFKYKLTRADGQPPLTTNQMMDTGTDATQVGSSTSNTGPLSSMSVVSSAPPMSQPVILEASPTTKETPTVKKRKNASVVWEHFIMMRNPDGSKMAKPKAKCNHCGSTFVCHSKDSGTSSMKSHLLNACTKCPLFISDIKQKKLVFESGSSGKLVAKAFDPELARLSLARMIVKDELPFSFVEGQGFRDFMSTVQPMFKKISRRQITRDIWELYQCEKLSIKNMIAVFGQRVSLTTDTWTSIQNINYLVLTAHFVDDGWVLHKKILSFCTIANHKGKTIGQIVETQLNLWGIEKVFTIVVDNASPNQLALDYMKEKIGNWDQLIMNGKFLHMRCCCHILNLIVRDGMAELDTSIDGIRNCVKYIRSSPQRLKLFRKCAAQEKIEHKGGIVPLDVSTRWNSTFFMLEIALKYRKAFMRLADEDSQFDDYFAESPGGRKRVGPPISTDWEKAARLVKFLKTYCDATLAFSGTSFVTSNQVVLWLTTILGEIERYSNGDDELFASIADAMKLKFDKYWGSQAKMNKIILIAVVLDPRYKLLFIDFFFEKLETDKTKVPGLVKEVRDLFKKLHDEYAKNDPEAAAASFSSVNPSSNSSQINASVDSHMASMQEFMKLRQQKDVVEIKNEVDKYLAEPSEDLKNSSFNLLMWWKENTGRYPVLSQIARDVFAIPASTVASESAFSLGGRVIDPFRSSLTPDMVECLVCTSDWIRESAPPLWKDTIKEEMEQYEECEKLQVTECGPSIVDHVEDVG